VSDQFRERRAEAEELGLWTQVRTTDEAEKRRADLAGLGFEDRDSDRWNRNVATLREAKAQATPSDRAARRHRGERGQGQGEAWQEVAAQRRPRLEEPG
jgi:hypothetical protein